jgi:hypothetical protein
VVTGAIYDRYQSCAPMMSAYIALSVIAGCLYAMLAQPKRLYNTENVFVCSVFVSFRIDQVSRTRSRRRH